MVRGGFLCGIFFHCFMGLGACFDTMLFLSVVWLVWVLFWLKHYCSHGYIKQQQELYTCVEKPFCHSNTCDMSHDATQGWMARLGRSTFPASLLSYQMSAASYMPVV
jgi:hypothetical protein